MKHRCLWPGFIVGFVASIMLGWLIGNAATQLTTSAYYVAVVAAAVIAMTIFYVISWRVYRRHAGEDEAASGVTDQLHTQ